MNTILSKNFRNWNLHRVYGIFLNLSDFLYIKYLSFLNMTNIVI